MVTPITALYAALLVAVFVVLSVRIGLARGKTGISMLDGGNEQVLVDMRRHGNFIEHVPLLLVLMAIIEVNDGSPAFLHLVGIALVICRIAHPLGLRNDRVQTPLRFLGAGGTFLVTIVLGVMVLWQGLSAL